MTELIVTPEDIKNRRIKEIKELGIWEKAVDRIANDLTNGEPGGDKWVADALTEYLELKEEDWWDKALVIEMTEEMHTEAEQIDAKTKNQEAVDDNEIHNFQENK